MTVIQFQSFLVWVSFLMSVRGYSLESLFLPRWSRGVAASSETATCAILRLGVVYQGGSRAPLARVECALTMNYEGPRGGLAFQVSFTRQPYLAWRIISPHLSSSRLAQESDANTVEYSKYGNPLTGIFFKESVWTIPLCHGTIFHVSRIEITYL